MAKKSHQKRLSLLSATPSLREGATCVGAFAGCAAELTSLLRNSVRTTAASQLTKHERTCAHATPQTPRRRRIHKGFGNHTGHRCVRPPVGAPFQPSPGGEGANTGPSAAMARVDVWFLFFGFQSPCVRAEERSARDGWGCRRTPPTSTSDLPQLFERSAQRVVSSAARPAREHRRLPRAQHGDTDSRAGVLW